MTHTTKDSYHYWNAYLPGTVSVLAYFITGCNLQPPVTQHFRRLILQNVTVPLRSNGSHSLRLPLQHLSVRFFNAFLYHTSSRINSIDWFAHLQLHYRIPCSKRAYGYFTKPGASRYHTHLIRPLHRPLRYARFGRCEGGEGRGHDALHQFELKADNW